MKSMVRLTTVVLFILAACSGSLARDVVSFYSMVSERDAVLIPKIEGTWKPESGGKDEVSFHKTGDNFYTISIKTDELEYRYEGMLTRIGNSVLLDLLPITPDGINNSYYSTQFFRAHALLRVAIDGNILYLNELNYRWFHKNIVENKSGVSYLFSPQAMLLTLPAAELRSFIARHMAEPDFFREVDTLVRSLAEESRDRPILQSSSGMSRPDIVPRQEGCMPAFPYKDGWLGGDGGLSVPISPSQTVWLFGDTLVGRRDQTTNRSGTKMFTTIGISTCGPDKVLDMKYYWRNMQTKDPGAFFESYTTRYRYWQIDAFTHGNNLYVVMQKTAPKPEAAPEEVFGWSAIGLTLAKITDPGGTPPRQWKIDLFPWSNVFDAEHWNGLAGDGKYLYLFMLKDPWKTYLVRLPLEHVEAPEGHLEYFSKSGTWKTGMAADDAKILFDDAFEGTVFYHPKLHRWLMVYGAHYGAKTLLFRSAAELTGPWSEARTLYEPPELEEGNPLYEKDNFCYSTRAHPQFLAPDSDNLLITYTCNSNVPSKMLANMNINVPKVVIIPIPH